MDFKRFKKLLIKLNIFVFKITKYFVIIKNINGLKGGFCYNLDSNPYTDFI